MTSTTAPKPEANRATREQLEALAPQNVVRISVGALAIHSPEKGAAMIGFYATISTRGYGGLPLVLRVATRHLDAWFDCENQAEADFEAVRIALAYLAEELPQLKGCLLIMQTHNNDVDRILRLLPTSKIRGTLRESARELQIARHAWRGHVLAYTWFPKRIEAKRELYERRFRYLRTRLRGEIGGYNTKPATKKMWVDLYAIGKLLDSGRINGVELSLLEAIVKHLNLRNKSPSEIAEAIGLPNRSITNAMHRSRLKCQSNPKLFMRGAEKYSYFPSEDL